ncbi:LPS assembly lipoprotein LptE [Elusimicrobiota bacterium]
MKSNFVVKAVLFLSLVLAGCASPYSPASQILPEHIKNIYIKPFVNNTTQYGLEDKFTLAVVDEFIRDGRWAVINKEEDADGMLVAEISKYIKEPLTYDASMVVQQYKLWILVNVYFVDKVNNVTLWEEPNLEGIQIYYDASSPGGRTEEEVVEIIWENMSRDIVKRTVEGFGSVTGASEKKVPQ